MSKTLYTVVIECDTTDAKPGADPESIIMDALSRSREGVRMDIKALQTSEPAVPWLDGAKALHVPVAEMVFVPGYGNTIWVNDAEGSTVLRIWAPAGKTIVGNDHCENNVCHADLRVEGDIEICLPAEVSALLD